MKGFNRWRKAQIAERRDQLSRKFVSQREDYWRQFFKRNFMIDLEFFRGKVLEVGCGSTGVIHFIDKKRCFKVGIDPLISSLRSKMNFSDAYLIVGIGEKLPFKDNSFNIVLCINVLDHCLNPQEVLKEIRRVLKEDGLLIFQVNTFQFEIFPSRIAHALRILLSLIDLPHPYHFSHHEIVSLLRTCGFKIIKERRKIPSLKKFKDLIAFLILQFRLSCIIAKADSGVDD